VSGSHKRVGQRVRPKRSSVRETGSPPTGSSAPCAPAGPTARSMAQARNAPQTLTAGIGTYSHRRPHGSLETNRASPEATGKNNPGWVLHLELQSLLASEGAPGLKRQLAGHVLSGTTSSRSGFAGDGIQQRRERTAVVDRVLTVPAVAGRGLMGTLRVR
jgi:hypothetical protein